MPNEQLGDMPEDPFGREDTQRIAAESGPFDLAEARRAAQDIVHGPGVPPGLSGNIPPQTLLDETGRPLDGFFQLQDSEENRRRGGNPTIPD